MNARDKPPKGEAAPRSHRKPSWGICCRLADNVKKYRLMRGYTQHELARQCSFAGSYVGDVEQAAGLGTMWKPQRVLNRENPKKLLQHRDV